LGGEVIHHKRPKGEELCWIGLDPQDGTPQKGREKLQTLFAMDGYLANCIVQRLLKKIAAQATN
jgi:hypothetical protein